MFQYQNNNLTITKLLKKLLFQMQPLTVVSIKKKINQYFLAQLSKRRVALSKKTLHI